jgi:hypothetical protein
MPAVTEYRHPASMTFGVSWRRHCETVVEELKSRGCRAWVKTMRHPYNRKGLKCAAFEKVPYVRTSGWTVRDLRTGSNERREV